MRPRGSVFDRTKGQANGPFAQGNLLLMEPALKKVVDRSGRLLRAP